jgi:hypothetical protein
MNYIAAAALQHLWPPTKPFFPCPAQKHTALHRARTDLYVIIPSVFLYTYVCMYIYILCRLIRESPAFDYHRAS